MASAINLDSRATINAERLTDIARHDQACAGASSSRCTGPTSSRSPASTRNGPRSAAAPAITSPSVSSRERRRARHGFAVLPARESSSTRTSARSCPTIRSSCRSTSPAPGTSTPAATTWGCIRGRARPSRNISGPQTPWTYLQDEKKYTWMKAPRYEGRPMEVGPLARMLVAYASGHDDVRAMVKQAWTLGRSGRRRCSRRSGAWPRAASRPCSSRGG